MCGNSIGAFQTASRWTPLHYAVANENTDAIKLLLAAGADPTLTTLIEFDSSPLDEAGFGGFKEGIELLEAALAGRAC